MRCQRPHMARRMAAANRKIASEKDELARLHSERSCASAQWKAIDTQIAVIEARRTGRSRARAATTAAARLRPYRDGTRRDLPAHREIARRHAWNAHKGKKSSLFNERSPAGLNHRMPRLRMEELERLFLKRYGPALPD